MIRKTTTALMVLACLAAFPSRVQGQAAARPYSFTSSGLSCNIDRIGLPVVDWRKLMEEDALHTDKSSPLRIGVVRPTGYTINNSGRTDSLPGGGMLWRLEVASPEAVQMDFTLTSFDIPEGASVYVYSPGREQAYGPYTNADRQKGGIVVTDDIIGDKAVIEYYEPAGAPYRGSFEVSRVGHIYKDFLNITPQGKGHWGSTEGDCHINVVCPEGDNWRNQAKSVVLLRMATDSGEYLCSGAMVNNTSMDKTPYVLSAEHCWAENCTFKYYFCYQSKTCEGSSGVFNRVAIGGDVIAKGDRFISSDFMLMKITGELRDTYRDSIVFAGWDATGACSVGAAIHHPGGDVKKISIPKSIHSYNGPYNRYWSTSWKVNPNKGVTEQGSSGSPLFNANGLIIGDLSNGNSSCDYPSGIDNYGKLSYSWLNGNAGSDSQKLQPWLDPGNTGALTCPPMAYNGTVLGIGNHTEAAHTFSIAPNPNAGHVTVEGDFDGIDGVCRVYNAMGLLVDTRRLTLTPSFTMGFHLPDGVYFVEITGGSHVYKSKMVIVR